MAGTLGMFSAWWSIGTHNCSSKVHGTIWSWPVNMGSPRPQTYHTDCIMTSSQGSSPGRCCQPGLSIQFDVPLVVSGSTALLFGMILPVCYVLPDLLLQDSRDPRTYQCDAKSRVEWPWKENTQQVWQIHHSKSAGEKTLRLVNHSFPCLQDLTSLLSPWTYIQARLWT